ncbi:MAG: hypothetical protein LBU53_10685 [Zoogloeaceae bacterium]|jgi:hypothetical protein|nr:hypothetical protein [Zoogloeaceae bacterium]
MSATHTNDPLTRRLSRLIDVAHDVRDAKALDEPQMDSLILAAAILDSQERKRAIPNYAMDLLQAARRAHHFKGSEESLDLLEEVIIWFESMMPVALGGDVMTYGESMFAAGED